MPTAQEQADKILENKRRREAKDKAEKERGYPDPFEDTDRFLPGALKRAREKGIQIKLRGKLAFPPDNDESFFAPNGFLPYMDAEVLQQIAAAVYPKPKPPPVMRPTANTGPAAAPSAHGLKDITNATKAGIIDPFAELLNSAKANLDPNSIKAKE